MVFRPKVELRQSPEKEAQQIQSTSIASSATRKKDKGPIWQQQSFATGAAYHKFTEGCQRINTLRIRYEKNAPEISHHLQVLKCCFEGLPLALDNRRIGLEAEGVVKEVEMDVEKTRKWKFRFLDLIIEMLLDENGMKGNEVMNVLLHTEVITERFRKNLQGNSKGKESGEVKCNEI
jgi:hypothetical protein